MSCFRILVGIKFTPNKLVENAYQNKTGLKQKKRKRVIWFLLTLITGTHSYLWERESKGKRGTKKGSVDSGTPTL